MTDNGDRRPLRLRLSRAKGFDLQALSLATNGLPAVNCARPGRWGNGYRVGGFVGSPPREIETAAGAVQLHRDRLAAVLRIYPAYVHPLRGRNLACWCALCAIHETGRPMGRTCPDCEPCHADTLLEFANR